MAETVGVPRKEERLREAKKSLVAAMPPPEAYAAAPPDMVAGLQKRDTKWQTCLTPQLLEELGDALLPTCLLELSYDEAMEMRTCYRLNQSDVEKLPHVRGLLQRLETVWRTRFPNGDSFAPLFCKLSFMSPKDLAVHPSFAPSRSQFETRVMQLFSEAPILDRLFLRSELLHHPRLPELWLKALNNSLQVRSPLEALTLLCASSRCHEELNDALIDRHFFRCSIVLRPWVHIRPGFEFRVYVCNSRITCASQYEPVHFPEVWAERSFIPSVVGEFVRDRVVPQLRKRLPSFVVDVVMVDDAQRTLAVCELNPFAASSSACLFSWRTDSELLLLGPETWRFAPPPQPGAASDPKSQLTPDWQVVADDIFAKAQQALLLRWIAGAAAVLAAAAGWWLARAQ